jgi:hypothetical protein
MNVIAKAILWIARILGTLVLAFLLLFVLGHFFKERSFGTPYILPLVIVVGLGLALKWEGLGGLIATLGNVIGFVLDPRLDLIDNPYVIAMWVPGLLYLIYWVLAKRRPGPVYQAAETHDPNQDEP